jgi:hypothetical protein
VSIKLVGAESTFQTCRVSECKGKTGAIVARPNRARGKSYGESEGSAED